jgi:hypothetical protein
MQLATFYTRVAQKLGILPVGVTLSAEDAEVIANAYESLVHELGEHGLSWWNPDEDVPDQYSDTLVGMTAAAVVDEFTVPEPRRSQLIMQGAFGLPVASVAERRLRALTRVGTVDADENVYY